MGRTTSKGAQFWTHHVEQYRHGELTLREYCERHALDVQILLLVRFGWPLFELIRTLVSIREDPWISQPTQSAVGLSS